LLWTQFSDDQWLKTSKDKLHEMCEQCVSLLPVVEEAVVEDIEYEFVVQMLVDVRVLSVE
jgi:hypothetical protein